MRPLTVALAQIRSGPDPADNAAVVADAAHRAAARGSSLLVLPEATMASFRVDPRRVAEPLDGPFVHSVCRAAADSDLTLVVGMFEAADDDRAHNTLLVAGPSGPLGSYRKIHLFDTATSRESSTIAPGDAVVTIDLPGLRLGLATCFDVRFADQFAALRAAACDVVALPASWAAGPRKVEQWRDLTAVRAMDSQAWLLACDQAGVDSPEPLGVGYSRVVDPLGDVVAEAGVEEELLVATIDLDRVAQVRASVPI